jgi:predicted ATP-grasp superfamily ATP-dependent carboligase
VIITGGEHAGGLAAVRGLADARFEPIVTVEGDTAITYASLSRMATDVVRVPPADSDADGFAAEVGRAAVALAAEAVLPGTEPAMLALADRPEAVDGARVAVPPSGVVRTAIDKAVLPALAGEAGIPMPPTRLAAPGTGMATVGWRFPVVVKPPRSDLEVRPGVLRRYPVRVAPTAAAVEQALRALPTGFGIVQAYVAGALVAVGGVFWEGRLMSSVRYEAERTWPPGAGVISSAVTTVPDPDLDERIARLLGRIGWNGIFQMQFIRSGGVDYLIDLNPRLYASLALPMAAGANQVGLWASLVLGRPLPYRRGVRYRSDEHEPRALARQAMVDARAALAAALPRRRTAHSVLSWRDPAPAVASVSKLGELLPGGLPRRRARDRRRLSASGARGDPTARTGR